MDIRWDADSSIDQRQIFAKELVSLQPDVILSSTTPATAALHRETRTIPVVFVIVSDPLGSGLVASLARPGGNLTGFMFQEPTIAAKMLELLTEIAPGVKRAAIMFNPDTAPYFESYYVPPFENAARVLKVAPISAPVHNDAEIERFIASLGREPGSGLIGGAGSLHTDTSCAHHSSGGAPQHTRDLQLRSACERGRFAFIRNRLLR
jgi:putative ABC transport system substrate-binding protein